ncbi:FecR domain-containing protein [Novosphingobium sp. YJ-S2-02]|uniref:FecR domain-containing protein n=1 Tax=Novosphingobium aureum TaxID=2792964 RepID=A0A931MK50_9SPHN|nr:FecR domain-containing protein [Novosphingobium aureum]MBH0112089.1 FecR domain-containing protein [Novosphingobium aureum]
MTARDTSSEIEDRAAEWVARMELRELTPAEQAQLESWIAGDRRRLGALVRGQAIVTSFGARLDDTPQPVIPADELPQPRSAVFSRRGALFAGFAALGAVGIGISTLRPFASTAYATEIGEIRRITLEDGSVVTLNSGSRMTARLAGDQRHILLERGEALFRIAPDTGRPFAISAGGNTFTTSETLCSLRCISPREVRLSVLSGEVGVDAANHGGPHFRARRNQLVTITPARGVEIADVASEELEQETVWRSGKIAFSGDSLYHAAAEFARYNTTRIVVDDAAVGDLKITGLFDSNDPARFAEAVAGMFALEVKRVDDEIVLSAP